jgi:integrase
MTRGIKKVRSVPVYLALLKKAGKSERTIEAYQNAFISYSRFLDVPVDEIHHYLDADKLLEYTDTPEFARLAHNTRRGYLSVLSHYMKLNGVEFDELEFAVVRLPQDRERHDKPLEYETLKKMMDIADIQMRAWITFLVSTGCRSGESAEVLISDVHANRVTIRNEIAKGGRGGTVFLTAEAREYLDQWLRERSAYMATADKKLRACGNNRPENDQRLFAVCAVTLRWRFRTLYQKVDGERNTLNGGTLGMIRPHSCRAYFRTHAATTMGIDLVEGLMRHTGYLNAAYVRMTDDERERQFKAGEPVLYITRADHRIQQGKLSELERRNEDLVGRLQQIEQSQALVDRERDGIRAAGAEYVRADDVERIVKAAVAAAFNGKK